MNDRVVVYTLAGAFLAVLIWRSIPRAPVAVVDSSATLGAATVVPTLPADAIVGQSFDVADGDAGPSWYTAAYPGLRAGLPPIPSAVELS